MDGEHVFIKFLLRHIKRHLANTGTKQ